MQQLRILVTGATGKTGAAVVAQLREQGVSVRAVVRRRDQRSEQLERRGVETVVADLFDVEQLKDAMRGTARAYYCPPLHPHAIQSGAAFAIAARAAKLEAIVGLTQWLASPSSRSLHTRQLWQIEQLFAQLPGVAYVRIAPGYFADNYLRLIDFAAFLGIFPVLTGASRDAPPSNEDIARVSVAALLEPVRHAGRLYRPTGPKLLSAHDMVPIISRVLGKRVLAVELPWWMFERAARLQGVDSFSVMSLRLYVEEHKRGAFEFGATTDDVREVTGQEAESFETTARRYAAAPFAQNTFSNRARALLNFMRVPFTPGFSVGAMEKEPYSPQAPTPLFAMEDERWKKDRTETTAEHSRSLQLAAAP